MLSSLGVSFLWSLTKDVKISVVRDAFQVVEYQQKFWNKGFPFGMGILTGFFAWIFYHENFENTPFESFVNKVQESAAVRYAMHITGISLIILVIALLHPIDHDRDHDINFSSASLLTGSQILIPLGLTLNFIPMALNRSDRLRAFMGSTILKPHATLLTIMVPLSGTTLLGTMYNAQDGIYFDFKTYLIYAIAHWIILALISLILWMLVLSPMINSINLHFDGFRYGDARDGDAETLGNYSFKRLEEPNEEVKDNEESVSGSGRSQPEPRTDE